MVSLSGSKDWLANCGRLALFRCFMVVYRWLHRRGVLPYGQLFGQGRGLPVGRYYVEGFLRRNAHRVRGHCLEFGDPKYKGFFPEATRYEVISVVPGPGIDYLCDIHRSEEVPVGVFDAIICTQVFEHLAHPERAAESLFRMLKPGGLVLLTAPFLNPVHYSPTDFRRFTPECLEMILREAGFDVEEVDFGGNCLVGTGNFVGMVTEDFTPEELDAKDARFPYNVLVRARRPGDEAAG
jgi:SAM-dependent methyltransferase